MHCKVGNPTAFKGWHAAPDIPQPTYRLRAKQSITSQHAVIVVKTSQIRLTRQLQHSESCIYKCMVTFSSETFELRCLKQLLPYSYRFDITTEQMLGNFKCFALNLDCSTNIRIKWYLHIRTGQDRITLHQKLFSSQFMFVLSQAD